MLIDILRPLFLTVEVATWLDRDAFDSRGEGVTTEHVLQLLEHTHSSITDFFTSPIGSQFCDLMPKHPFKRSRFPVASLAKSCSEVAPTIGLPPFLRCGRLSRHPMVLVESDSFT